MKNLSIVIPAYNFRHSFRIIAIAITSGSSEIIVVDSSPVAASLPDDPRIKLVHLPKKTWPGEARNIGWQAAQGEYILFVDADVEFKETTHIFVRDHENLKPMNNPPSMKCVLEFMRATLQITIL